MSARHRKLHDELDLRDLQLRERAMSKLREVAAGQDTGFFVAEQDNPWPEVRPSARGTAILAEAEDVIALAHRLHVDTTALAAWQIMNAFARATDLRDDNRLGPARLAAKLLSDLEER